MRQDQARLAALTRDYAQSGFVEQIAQAVAPGKAAGGDQQ